MLNTSYKLWKNKKIYLWLCYWSFGQFREEKNRRRSLYDVCLSLELVLRDPPIFESDVIKTRLSHISGSSYVTPGGNNMDKNYGYLYKGGGLFWEEIKIYICLIRSKNINLLKSLEDCSPILSAPPLPSPLPLLSVIVRN